MSYIESHDIRKIYGSSEVLRGLSFKAESSEVTFLAGKNGAGKTTWIRIAIGIIRASSGQVTFDGRSANQIRNQLAIVFDEPPVYPHLSGAENLKVLSGLSKPDSVWKLKVLGDLQLDPHLLRRKAGHYSLGQRHRLAVAAALLRRPLYFLLDEPAVGLDVFSWELVRESLRSLAENGSVIILTSQDFNILETVADKVVILNNGVSVFSGSTDDLINLQPPSVFIKAPSSEMVLKAFSRAQVLDLSKGLVEIRCSSIEEAESITMKVQQMNLPLHELRVHKSTLEESFRRIVVEDSKKE